MLIIPVERSIDWRHPPWVTLGLILACVLVFTLYQSGDNEHYAGGLTFYLDAELDEMEAPAYRHFLQRHPSMTDAEIRDSQQAFESAKAAEERYWLAVQMAPDRQFYEYLQANQQRHLTAEQQASWQRLRTELHEDYFDHASPWRYGLIPSELSLSALVTHQFLHGGLGHLIGNMLFLFLLGFTVERALGGARFLLAYLSCGVLAGLGFALLSLDSSRPLIGASGAVSGLLGMYLALFGLQNIRFFFTVGVYFNYFKAPALVILPFWIAKEFYDQWSGESSAIAHMAHVGGMLAGAGLVALLGKSWLQVKEDFFDPTEEEADNRFRQEYGRAMAELSEMNFEPARLQFEALRERYPHKPVLLEHLYRLARLRPDHPRFRDSAQSMMDTALRQHHTEKLVEIWRDYMKVGEAHQPLPASSHNQVMLACLRDGNLKDAEKAFDALKRTGDLLLTEEACRLLKQACERQQLATRVRHYSQLLEEMGAPSGSRG